MANPRITTNTGILLYRIGHDFHFFELGRPPYLVVGLKLLTNKKFIVCVQYQMLNYLSKFGYILEKNKKLIKLGNKFSDYTVNSGERQVNPGTIPVRYSGGPLYRVRYTIANK